MILIKLSPYAKAVVALIGTIVSVVAQVLQDGSFDADETTTLVVGITTAYGVYATRNKPAKATSPDDVGSVA